MFTAEEVLLVGLYRLSCPNTQGNPVYRDKFGMDQPTVSKCFSCFVSFVADKWGYLLKDNMEFWKPYLPLFAEKIRQKLCHLGCEEYLVPGCFRVFGFLDNTLNPSCRLETPYPYFYSFYTTLLPLCRPGGGPTQPGVDAPRHDPLLQRAFYNGWKKAHGLKWQTISLPNGMEFHAWGPMSLRSNDITSLARSRLEDQLEALFEQEIAEGQQFYVVYGDSAYAYG